MFLKLIIFFTFYYLDLKSCLFIYELLQTKCDLKNIIYFPNGICLTNLKHKIVCQTSKS